MTGNVNWRRVLVMMCVAAAVCFSAPALADLVTPISQVTDYDDFGDLAGGPLVSNFGTGMMDCVGVLTTWAYKADSSFYLGSTEILAGDLTIVYSLEAGSTWPGPNELDYLQVNLTADYVPPIVAAGYNTAVSDIVLTRVNLEDDAKYQLEFGDDLGGSADAFNLLEGETLEMFAVFREAYLFDTTAVVDGGAIPVGGIATYGAHAPEPITILMIAGGLGSLAFGIRRKRR